jgi:hypothetical protein
MVSRDPRDETGLAAASEKAQLQGSHRRLLGRLGVIEAAEVERAVGDEKPQLVGG